MCVTKINRTKNITSQPTIFVCNYFSYQLNIIVCASRLHYKPTNIIVCAISSPAN